MLELDAVQTLAFAGLTLLLGSAIRKRLPVLERYNIPTPVIGGLIVAVAIVVARSRGVTFVSFDTTLQSPLMIAFFTSIGFSASPKLLRAGGPQMILFLALASVFAIVQNFVGGAIAVAFGLPPLFGVLSGSVTLTGGPATGIAFAPLFEQAGVHGAASIAIAVAMAGIVSGSVLGGPIATLLIDRYKLRNDGARAREAAPVSPLAHSQLRAPMAPEEISPEALQRDAIGSMHVAPTRDNKGRRAANDSMHIVLKSIIVLLLAMWAGSFISRGFAALGITLPAYVGAMIVGASIRTLDDFTGWIRLSQRTLDTLGGVSLSFFLTVALMTLKLWELSGLALPMLANLFVQIVIVALFCVVVFRAMGRDYEAAVMSGGYMGFMLGTTANAVAVMGTLVERYCPAPRAFLVAPIVGAFFLDFTNALIITTFVNVWR